MKVLNNREEMLGLLPKSIRIAEVGVFRGEFSRKIIDICQPSEMTLVDLWNGKMTSGDKDGKNIVKISDMKKIYQEEILPYFSEMPNVKIFQGASDRYFDLAEDNSLDAIYIDAAHTYRAVKRDLENARRVVTTGGIIMGHDYHEEKFPGVYKAVNEFMQNNNLKMSYLTTDGMPSFYIVNENKN